MSNAILIQAPRTVVWQAINDPAVLKDCIPGCSELTGSAEDGFAAVVHQHVGPIKATFRGAVSLLDMDAPNSYRIVGEGKGGPAGFAKGEAKVELREQDGATELSYHVEAKIGGKLAQLGARLINGFAQKMAENFFAELKSRIERPS